MSGETIDWEREASELRDALRDVASELFDVATSDTLDDVKERLLALEASIRQQPSRVVSRRTRSFVLSSKEVAKFAEWNRKHLDEHHGGKEPYSGCVGGRLTFSFTGTSLGQIATVTCNNCANRTLKKKPPQAEGDLTDWDDFG